MKVFNEEKLQRVYEYILEYQKSTGHSPTYKEIMSECELGGYATVYRHINELQNRGLIDKSGDDGRAIGIVDKYVTGNMQRVSIVGECPCGMPIEAIENIEASVMLPTEIFGNNEHFILRAKGNSMVNTGIFDGDLMIVRKQESAVDGDIVVAMIGDTATTKIFKRKKGNVILRAANDELHEDGTRVYPDIVTKECAVLGIVDNVIHKPKLR